MNIEERVATVEQQQDDMREKWFDFLEDTHRNRADYERSMTGKIGEVTKLLSAMQTVSNQLTKSVDKIVTVQERQDQMIHVVEEQSRQAMWILKNGGRQGVLQRQDRLEEQLTNHPESCPIGQAFQNHLGEHKAGKLTRPQKMAITVAVATATPGWVYGIVAFGRWIAHRFIEMAA